MEFDQETLFNNTLEYFKDFNLSEEQLRIYFKIALNHLI